MSSDEWFIDELMRRLAVELRLDADEEPFARILESLRTAHRSALNSAVVVERLRREQTVGETTDLDRIMARPGFRLLHVTDLPGGDPTLTGFGATLTFDFGDVRMDVNGRGDLACDAVADAVRVFYRAEANRSRRST